MCVQETNSNHYIKLIPLSLKKLHMKTREWGAVDLNWKNWRDIFEEISLLFEDDVVYHARPA